MLTVYVVCGSEKEAEKIAVALVEERLAACVNYFPCRSVFKWKGRMKKVNEWVLFAKAVEKNYPAIETRVIKLHSYKLPAVFAWNDSTALAAYEKWVGASCRK